MRVYKFLIALQLVLLDLLYLIDAKVDTTIKDELGKTTAQILEMRGYKAIDHRVTTSDGYVLNLVQGLNPLINNGSLKNKDPILFVHGILTNGNFFVVNSRGAQPKDYSDLSAGKMSIEKLKGLLTNDPASKSLVFTAMNFGHEIWILNRRGTIQSLGHTIDMRTRSLQLQSVSQNILSSIDSSTDRSYQGDEELHQLKMEKILRQLWNQSAPISDHLNPGYWNFSFDEPALIDVPETIDYILKRTGRSKVTLVGFSMGGALCLMTLAAKPEYAHKLSKVVLWAPAFYPVSRRGASGSSLFKPLYESYIGPTIPPTMLPSIQRAIADSCATPTTQYFICDKFYDVLVGYSGHQLSLPGGMAPTIDIDSSRSGLHMVQAAKKGKMHFYDFSDAKENSNVYGQPTPPIYDLARIESHSISLWAGNTDGLVPADTVVRIMSDLRVPAKTHIIDEPGVYFNHIAFALHDNVSQLVIIPSLKTIEEPPI